jgi:hypothetical protein
MLSRNQKESLSFANEWAIRWHAWPQKNGSEHNLAVSLTGGNIIPHPGRNTLLQEKQKHCVAEEKA